MSNTDRPGDRHADEVYHRPLLSLEQEAVLLMVWVSALLLYPVAAAIAPTLRVLPSWGWFALAGLWLFAFFQWAAKGGVPPRW